MSPSIADLGPPTSLGLYDLVSAATLAPSSHNTQPWSFQPLPHGVRVLADGRRRLLVADPDDRELTMSCGAAVLTFRVAAAAHGFGTQVELGHPSEVARLTWTTTADPSLADLADAVGRRHVWRGGFTSQSVPDETVAELAEACRDEGASLTLVRDGALRARLADLVAEGDRRQHADPAWRRELASWMRPHGSPDGLPRPRYAGPLGPWVVRHFDLGRLVARHDRRRALAAPLLAVLTTPRDTDTQRLAAGQAFQRLSLVATRHQLAVGLLNQPCQVPELRGRLAELVPSGTPQLVLVIGHPDGDAGTTSRRLTSDVMGDRLGPAGPGTGPGPTGPRVSTRVLGETRWR